MRSHIATRVEILKENNCGALEVQAVDDTDESGKRATVRPLCEDVYWR